MRQAELDSFVARARALVDASPPSSVAETRAWVVDPLLSVLGWNVGSSACEFGVDVEGLRFDYVLSVADGPAVFVLVESFDEPLDGEDELAIGRAMIDTGVDRAIYTNGRELRLLAGTENIDRFRCAVTELDEYDHAVTHVAEHVVRQRFEGRSRPLFGRHLAIRRSELAAAIAAVLTETTDAAYESEFRTAAEQFVGELANSLTESSSESDLDGRSPSGEPPAEERPDATRSTDREKPIDTEASDAGSIDESLPSKNRSIEGSDDESPQAGDGEYVVRFFDDRASVGAVGHSRSDMALVEATEFLFERGLTGIRLPWAPERGETVLNDRPVRADGSPMDVHRTLSNGVVLDTSGGVEDHAARLEALASRAGVRVMLTGDWSSLE